MSFRRATIDDEEFFWRWRSKNESDGREGGWWPHKPTSREQHRDWYLYRLGRINMLVWELDGEPSGVVRIDSNGEVAFDATQPRVMLEELLPYAEKYDGRLKAVVDLADTASSSALAAAGFREHPVRFYAYRP